MILVVLNTLGVEDYDINVEGANVSLFFCVNELLTLANGWKISGFASLAMKATVRPYGDSFRTSGLRNPTRTDMDQVEIK